MARKNERVDERLSDDPVKDLLYGASWPALRLSTSQTAAAIVVWSEGQMRYLATGIDAAVKAVLASEYPPPEPQPGGPSHRTPAGTLVYPP